MTGTWPHDLLGLGGVVLIAGAFIWAGLPPRRRRK